jgi:hypothetical protein
VFFTVWDGEEEEEEERWRELEFISTEDIARGRHN